MLLEYSYMLDTLLWCEVAGDKIKGLLIKNFWKGLTAFIGYTGERCEPEELFSSIPLHSWLQFFICFIKNICCFKLKSWPSIIKWKGGKSLQTVINNNNSFLGMMRYIERQEEVLERIDRQIVGLEEALGRIEEVVGRQQVKLVTFYILIYFIYWHV